MKLYLSFLMVLSLSFSYLPFYLSNNLTLKSTEFYSYVDQFSFETKYLHSIVYDRHRDFEFFNCNQTLKILSVNQSDLILSINNCSNMIDIPKDGKYHWVCDGYNIKYLYSFKSKVVYSMSYILNSDWIRKGRYNC